MFLLKKIFQVLLRLMRHWFVLIRRQHESTDQNVESLSLWSLLLNDVIAMTQFPARISVGRCSKVIFVTLARPSTGKRCWPRKWSLRSCRQSKSPRMSATSTATSRNCSLSSRPPPSPSTSLLSSSKHLWTLTSVLCTVERRAEETRRRNGSKFVRLLRPVTNNHHVV